MSNSTIEFELSAAWLQAIEQGKIVNRIVAQQNDPTARFRIGDELELGLQLRSGEPEFYTFNKTTSRAVELREEQRPIEGTQFCCQYSEHRSLRPRSNPRIGRQADISFDVGECRFSCQDSDHPLSLLRREPLLQVTLKHFRWNAYHNAFPFENRGHCLWVPTQVEVSEPILPHWPQELTTSLLEDLGALSQQCEKTAILFNSLHAGASVNHIHLQSVYCNQLLAVEEADVTDYRGVAILTGYEADAFCFDNRDGFDALANCITNLNLASVPFNLFVLRNRSYVFPRDIDNEIVAELAGDSPAGMDFAGRLIISDSTTYQTMDADRLRRGFRATVMSTRQLVDAWQLTR